MGRIVQTLATPGASTGGLTSAEVIALVRQYAGYEYIKTMTLNTTEVAAIDVTGLDSTVYSAFKIVSSRLGYGGSTTQNYWTLRILTGGSSVDSSTNYEYQAQRFYGGSTSNANSASGWSTQFGFGGPPSCADFSLDYKIAPGSSVDANIWFEVNDSKQGGYWPSSGIMAGIHTNAGAVPTGIRLEANQQLRAIQDNAYITVMGMRIKS